MKREEWESQIRQAKLEKERHILRAPSDGTILSSNLHSGQYIVPGNEVLIMGNLSTLRVCVEFDEMYAGYLKNASRALGQTKSFSPQTVTLKLCNVDPYVYPKRNLPAISCRHRFSGISCVLRYCVRSSRAYCWARAGCFCGNSQCARLEIFQNPLAIIKSFMGSFNGKSYRCAAERGDDKMCRYIINYRIFSPPKAIGYKR